jgi:hypothetical protein
MLKTQIERLNESIRILKQLKDLGISDLDPSYKELSKKFNDWVKGGDKWEGSIDFYRYNRIANVVLPVIVGKYAKCDFLVRK